MRVWILWRLLGRDAARAALEYAVGELEQYVSQALGRVAPCVERERALAAR